MKKFISIFLIGVLACSALSLVGCDDKSETPDEATSATENTAEASSDTTSQNTDNSAAFDLKTLQTYDAESGDPFAGAWRITEGEGSKLESFVYVFDGHGKATLVIDTVGYMSSYSVSDISKDKSTGDTFNCQLMFGINGSYDFEFSDSDSKAVLTNIESDKTTTMEKIDSFDCIPIPDSNAKIDENLAGAWYCESGEYLYLGDDGIMYRNQYGTMFTYYKYSAENGKLSATYTMQEEYTDEIEYTFEDDKLTFDGLEFEKIPESKLDSTFTY